MACFACSVCCSVSTHTFNYCFDFSFLSRQVYCNNIYKTKVWVINVWSTDWVGQQKVHNVHELSGMVHFARLCLADYDDKVSCLIEAEIVQFSHAYKCFNIYFTWLATDETRVSSIWGSSQFWLVIVIENYWEMKESVNHSRGNFLYLIEM